MCSGLVNEMTPARRHSMPFYSLRKAFQGTIDKVNEMQRKHRALACYMQLQKHQFEKNVNSWTKTISQNSMAKAKLKNFGNILHTVGALSFKTCHRSFSLENAVSLTSSHAAEPCCITMTQKCPSLSGKSPQSNNSLGEGKGEKRERGGGQTKGNLIIPGHGSSTSQQREIHHLQDQTETCAQGKAQ